MQSPINYATPANGAVNGSCAAAYWWGKNGVTMLKYLNSTAIAEAGWLSGFGGASYSPLGSNLPVPAVVRYFGVTRNTTRYSATPVPSGIFFGRIGTHGAVFPLINSWRMAI